VRGHPGALLHAFSHLLVNALDALPEGKAPSNRIRVKLATDADGWARVEISDTGEDGRCY
jgi:signal transduction histidine kinase